LCGRHNPAWYAGLSYLTPSAREATRGYIRIVDESGEDYLYNAKAFEIVQLPPRTERKVRATLA